MRLLMVPDDPWPFLAFRAVSVQSVSITRGLGVLVFKCLFFIRTLVTAIPVQSDIILL